MLVRVSTYADQKPQDWLRAARPPRRLARPPFQALAATAAVAAPALALGVHLPLLGAPILALLLGMAVAALRPLGRLRTGLGFISRYALQAAIVLLGTTISLTQGARVGASSLPVMLGSLAVALLVAGYAGARLAVSARLRTLIGVGTGICGASAIAAVSRVIGASEREIRYAISTIFAFNLLAVIAFPPVGHLLGMSQHAFGLWSGTAINDASSVVAAGYAYGHAAGGYALIVKLTRTTMIVPVSLYLSAAAARGVRAREAQGPAESARPGAVPSLRRVMPWFLLWFLAASAAMTLGAFGSDMRTGLSRAGLILTTVALAAVGLGSNFGEIRQTGGRPVALGALAWVGVSLTSLLLQGLSGSV